MNIQTYIVRSRSYDKYLEFSSSAGVFYWIARYIIEKSNGYVFGAVLENGEVFHKGISALSELVSMQGSKYVRSNLKNTFAQYF